MANPWRSRSAAVVAAAVVAGAVLPGPGPTTHAVGVSPAARAPQSPAPRADRAVLSPLPADASGLLGTGQPLARPAVTAALRPVLRGGALGPGPSPARVVDVASGAVLYAAVREGIMPASTMKLVTAASALDALGPDRRLRTRVVLVAGSSSVPRVVIVGAGDPSLSSTGTPVGSRGSVLAPSSLAELVADAVAALEQRGLGRVRVGYDASLFTGRGLHPSWAASFPTEGIVAPVSALTVDEGRVTPTSARRASDPAAEAGRAFADALRASGIRVTGTPKDITVPVASPTLAFVESPPVGVLVERTLAASDNTYAESLGRLGAAASGEAASFRGVARRAEALLEALGVHTGGARFADASGLSRDNRLELATLTDLLRVTALGFSSLHSGLPVAGATGSLATRFTSADQQAGRGVVRAKTGTLTGVVGLAGYATHRDGRLLAFAFVDDSATGGNVAARSVLDLAAATLVSCDCAREPEDAGTAPALPTP